MQRNPPNFEDAFFSVCNGSVKIRMYYCFGNKANIKKHVKSKVAKIEKLDTNLVMLNKLWDLFLESNRVLILTVANVAFCVSKDFSPAQSLRCCGSSLSHYFET